MSARVRFRAVRWIGLALALAVLSPSAAPAAGFFDFFFGSRPSSTPMQAAPSYANQEPASLSSPFDLPSTRIRPPESSGGGSVAYCVRTCDGQHFPVSHSGNMSEVQACGSLCPAAQTKIFRGGSIDTAVATDGAHYRDLPNAFVYRQHFVAGCTCNGHSPVGLARIDVKSDPTLHAGDIVATTGGLMSYRGREGKAEAVQFTPIDAVRVSSNMRQMLAATRVYAITRDDPLTANASSPAQAGSKGPPKDKLRRAQQ